MTESAGAHVDPRVERTRATVIATASELLLEGGTTYVTVDAVVARSGVAKTTIYRHWPSRLDLLRATFESLLPEVSEPQPGIGFREALQALVLSFVDPQRADVWKRTIAALIGASLAEPELARMQHDVASQQREVTFAILQLGIDEGVLPPDLDKYEALAQIGGPFLMATFSPDLEVDEAFAQRIVDLFIASHRC